MIRLAKPFIPEETVENCSQVLRSGNLVQGEFVREFENNLEEYLGVSNVIAVSSGTAALHLSLTVLGIGPGDEVIVPAFTFPATANVVELVGATPIFVDITIDDYCIDVEGVEKAITPKTRAIMPVHEFGLMADMDSITSLANKYKIKIIEDAACALGSEYNDVYAGTVGDLGCFSFHPRKAITTGEGGAIVAHDPDLAEKLRSLRNHGMEVLDNKVEFSYAGFNYRMTDFQAVLGSGQIKYIDYLIEQRVKIAGLYNDLLGNIGDLLIPTTFESRKNVYQTYHVLLENDYNRDDLISYFKQHGVETNIGAYCVPELVYYARKYNNIISCSVSAKCFEQGIALPIGNHVTLDDVDHICQIMNEYIV
jgi:perosamine synthetase